LMEFILYGLSVYSVISKKMNDGRITFNDLMGSMMNLGNLNLGDEEDFFSEDDR